MRCADPLHRFHFHSGFRLPALNFELISLGCNFFLDSYELWIERYGLEDSATFLVNEYMACVTGILQLESSANNISSDPTEATIARDDTNVPKT